MKNLSNFKKMNIFFVGIGGISMSGLAKISKYLGARVSGSDVYSTNFDHLIGKDIQVFHGHSSSHITTDLDLVVFSGAIKDDNPELMRAKELLIPIMERSEFLGVVSKLYNNVIVVSGSHGKTTVTSMLGHIFSTAKLKPTIHVGGECLNFKSNTVIGDEKYFIVEGCEYRESFLSLSPNTAVILNIDNDHLDYYITYKNVINAFNKFAMSSDMIFSNEDFSFVHKETCIVNKCYKADNIKITKEGYKYKVYYKNKFLISVTLDVMGRHNIENSLFAIAVARYYGISKKTIKKALNSYKGVKRRYEIIGEYLDVPVISDYAHHPSEIVKSIAGLKERFFNPLIIFQPHTYSRTESLKNEFVDSLKDNDVVIFSTYPAREKYNAKGSAYNLYRKLKNKHKFYAKDMAKLKNLLNELVINHNYDIIVVLGAGDLYDKFNEFL